LIESQKQEFTPISELKEIETLLNTLEVRLHNFQHGLPRLNRRRSLLNFGGTILKSVFGTATIHDINSLHEKLNGLQSSTSDIVHSLSNKITYVKKLDTVTRVNNIAIVNLSYIIKNYIIQSHSRFQKIARDILWLNVTLFNHSELLVTIRQLEYALMQMILRTYELFTAIQYVVLGKLPMNLINPTTLQNILRNVSLQLPGGFDLILSTKTEKIHLYYEKIKVTAVANIHGIKLIVNVALKTASQQFTLYKISVLPTRISNNNFVQYSIDFPCFAIDISQR